MASLVDPKPYLSAKPAADWNTFFDAVAEALELHLKEMSSGPGGAPVLVQDFPKTREGKFDTAFDVILWTVAGSQMAPTDNSGRRVPNGLRLMGERPSHTKFGYQEETVGWWELMTSEFQIFAKSNQRASELAAWFHRFLMKYAFELKWFKQYGVSYFRFVQRLADVKTQDFGEELYVRRLQYESRISMQTMLDAKTLEDIRFAIGTTADGELNHFEVNDDGQ